MKRSYLKRPLVLLVDDYADAREMYCEFLQYAGYGVIEAKNGREAVEKARASLPDIVLMDLSMPEMDGFEATRLLKTDGRTHEIPVIAVTGHTLAAHSEQAKLAGCEGFLLKPCPPDVLVAEIVGVLGRPTASEETRKPPVRRSIRDQPVALRSGLGRPPARR